MHIAYRRERTRRSGASAAWSVGGEQVVGIAGIPKMGTAGAQQLFDFVGGFLDHTRRPAGLNLAPQLDERMVGIVETPRQDRCNVQERDRVYPEEGGGVSDVKLRRLERTYVCRVRLIEKRGDFAEYGAGLPHSADLDAFLENCDHALLQNQQPAGRRGGTQHRFAGLIGCNRKSGKLPLE